MHINLDKLQHKNKKKTPSLPAAAFAQSLKLQRVCQLRAFSLFSYSTERNARETKMTTLARAYIPLELNLRRRETALSLAGLACSCPIFSLIND